MTFLKRSGAWVSRRASAPLLLALICLPAVVLGFIFQMLSPRLFLAPLLTGAILSFFLSRELYDGEDIAPSTAVDHVWQCALLYPALAFFTWMLGSCFRNRCDGEAVVVYNAIFFTLLGSTLGNAATVWPLHRRVPEQPRPRPGMIEFPRH